MMVILTCGHFLFQLTGGKGSRWQYCSDVDRNKLGISDGSSCGTLLCFSNEHGHRRSESIFLWIRFRLGLTTIFMGEF